MESTAEKDIMIQDISSKIWKAIGDNKYRLQIRRSGISSCPN